MEPSRYHDQIVSSQDDGGVVERRGRCSRIGGDSTISESLRWQSPSELQTSSTMTHTKKSLTMRESATSTSSYTQRRTGFFGSMRYLSLLIACLWIVPISAVMIEFENCLSDATKNDVPLQLQIVPQFVDAVFDTTDPAHNLRMTVWINVNGTFNSMVPLPSPNDTAYWNGNETDQGGKILDVPLPDALAPLRTTLFNKVNVLTYEPWSSSAGWCQQLKNGSCPLGPRFNINE